VKSEYESFKETFEATNLQLQQQHELNDKLKRDYESQHFHLVERDENIHCLKLEIEQQKQSLDNKDHDKEERYLSLSKKHDQLSDLLTTTTNENKKLTETNRQFENDLKENNQLFFDKSKQADDLDKQLQILNSEYKDFKIQFDQLQTEKNKVINDIKSLTEKIQNLEKEKSEYKKVKRRFT
jgi:chromosome segregation protein